MTTTTEIDFVNHVAKLSAMIRLRDNAAAMIEDDYDRAVWAIEELQRMIRWAREIKSAFKMQKVVSSNIKRVGYDPKRRVLRIEFKRASGGVSAYRYPDVEAGDFHALLQAESVGRYFNDHVKGRAFIREDEKFAWPRKSAA